MSAVKKAQEEFEAAQKRAEELKKTIDEKQQLQRERRQVERLIEAHELAEDIPGKEARFKELRRELMVRLMDLDHEVRRVVPHWEPVEAARRRRSSTWRKLQDHFKGQCFNEPGPYDTSYLPDWMPSQLGPRYGTGAGHTVSTFLQRCSLLEKGKDDEEDVEEESSAAAEG